MTYCSALFYSSAYDDDADFSEGNKRKLYET